MSDYKVKIQKGLAAQAGFTLIELLVVIGILAVLMAIVLIAINPARQFAQANETKRRSDVNALLNAISQYVADNKGTLPTGLATLDRGVAHNISNVNVATAADDADLCSALMPTYISSLPTNPTLNLAPIAACPAAGTTYDTGYTVTYGSATDTTNRRLTVAGACGQDCFVEPAGTVEVSVTR